MTLKEFAAFLLDPKLTAAAGGYAAYHYLGKGKDGWTPWMYAAGGVIVGFLGGRALQGVIAPAPAPQAAPQPVAAAASAGAVGEYVDLDAPMSMQQPLLAHQRLLAPPKREPRPVTPAGAEIMSSMGSYGGDDDEEGLGSYGGKSGDDVDEMVDAALAGKRGSN